MALTQKQENFCAAFIECGRASDAYRKAYSAENMKAETVHKRASELMANGAVAGRIDELRNQAMQRHQLTVDDLLAELEEARVIASTGERPQCGAMVQAIMGKAKLLGLDVPKPVTPVVKTYNFAVHRAGTELSND